MHTLLKKKKQLRYLWDYISALHVKEGNMNIAIQLQENLISWEINSW